MQWFGKDFQLKVKTGDNSRRGKGLAESIK